MVAPAISGPAGFSEAGFNFSIGSVEGALAGSSGFVATLGAGNESDDVQRVLVTPTPKPTPKPLPTIKVKSSLKVSLNGRRFSGRLKAANKACVGGIKVTLRVKGSKKSYGTTKTKPSGAWTITRKGKLKGKVYATTKAKTVNGVTCAAATIK